jgi:hypothetical protein
MGHVDVGVTQNVYGKSRCKEEARAVWLTPHFFCYSPKSFSCVGSGTGISVDQKAERHPNASPRLCLINAASSTGQCNTIQCVDSTMLAQENHLFGCT